MNHDELLRTACLRDLIREIPDFPKPGIVFKEITPLLANAGAFSLAVELLTQPFRHEHIDLVAAPESRGFILGAAVAQRLSAGFVPIRKSSHGPADAHAEESAMEYGTDCIEVYRDAIQSGDRVLLADDLLATGGTIAACGRLVERLGGTVAGAVALVELTYLNGRSQLRDYVIHSILTYDSETHLS